MVMAMNNFAIVILNYNTYDDTIVCVNSIKQFTTASSYKVYIVDNASPDKSGKKLAETFANDERVSVLISEKNLGFSGGNNIGIRAALKDNFEYVFLLNSDIILLNDAFAFMQNAFTHNDNVAVVGPFIYNSKKEYAQFARRGITLSMYLACRRGVVSIFPQLEKKLRFYNYSYDEDFVFDGMLNGCCFGIRADFIKEHSCLDDKVFMYYEEDILAHLLKTANKKAMIVASAQIIHNEGVATKKSSSDRMLFTRFYRWTSVLYVLKNYAKVNSLICKVISLMNIAEWRIMALRNPQYKEKLNSFINENKRVLK